MGEPICLHSPAAPQFAVASAAANALAVALERLGWSLRNVEIDLAEGRARITLRRDSLHVTLDAQHGRVTIEREIVEARVSKNVRAPQLGGLDRVLLGRQRFDGLRVAMRSLAHYVADNTPGLDRLAGRDIFRPLLAEVRP